MKAEIWDIPDYHAYKEVVDKEGRHGVRFVLDSRLTDQERKRLQQYDNFIAFGSCVHRYAPELGYDTVVFADI